MHQFWRAAACVVACGVGMNAAAMPMDLLASFADDIEPIQGNNGWSYGFYDGDSDFGSLPFTPDDFETLPVIEPNPSAFDPIWRQPVSGLVPGGFFTGVGKGYAHPNGPVPGVASADDEQWAVIRWSNPTALFGDALLDIGLGDWDGNSGDGVGYELFVDGASVDSGTISNSASTDFQVELLVPIQLTPTTEIDLAIRPLATAANDATRVRFDVLVPEPGVMLMATGCGLSMLRRCNGMHRQRARIG
ncbi:MAG: hypothetical protein AAF823_01885 [Planctomycetota bacterium]